VPQHQLLQRLTIPGLTERGEPLVRRAAVVFHERIAHIFRRLTRPCLDDPMISWLSAHAIGTGPFESPGPDKRQAIMKSRDFIRLENEFGAMNYRPLDVVLTRGQGIWVWDVDGN
jgi:hypothetical protein